MTTEQIVKTVQLMKSKGARAVLPKDYTPKLDFFQTERGIKLIKDRFERELSKALTLQRISAPRFLKIGDGLQDDLAGTQIPVGFKAKHTGQSIEMVHSLAKWKRYALGKYGFKTGEGLYTDMDAVRKDEAIDEIHSIYVDQWDWEKIITKQQRTIPYLKEVVRKIYSAILRAQQALRSEFPQLRYSLPKKIRFIHAEELEALYPDLTPQQREKRITQKYGAVFIIGIGHPLRSGRPHDLRAADYDDWSTKTADGKRGLNGDIIVWDPVRKEALELSSMGIRVDKESLMAQLTMMGLEERKRLKFHRGIIEDKIPLSIGGGIGQSRLCMLLLEKAHIGEVQSSVWPEETIGEFERRGIALL